MILVPTVNNMAIYRPLSEPLKPLKAFILDEEPLEPLKCLFGPLSDFIFSFEPLFATFCPKDLVLKCIFSWIQAIQCLA